MAKQYHYWPADPGFDAWDVQRLIDLGSTLPVVDVAVGSLPELDTVYWFHQDHPPTVTAVIEHARRFGEVDLRYPVILGPDLRVMDGMHRIARAVLEGRTTVRAVRFVELPEPDRRELGRA